MSRTRTPLGVVVAFGQPCRGPGGNDARVRERALLVAPRWRGAAPVERAILAGDAETGVCLMGVEAGLDTGPVYACESGRNRCRRNRRRVARSARRLRNSPARRTDRCDSRDGPDAAGGRCDLRGEADGRRVQARPRPSGGAPGAHRGAGNPRPGAWGVFGGKRVKVCRAHPELDADVAIATVDEHGRLRDECGRWSSTRCNLKGSD